MSKSMSAALAACLLLASQLIACSGDNNQVAVDDGGSTPPPPPPPPAPLRLSGTAAIGAAIANANIDLRCAGSSPGNYTLSSDAQGRYSLTVNSAPCLLRIRYGSPEKTLYSLALDAGIVNLTPFSSLVLASLAQRDPGAFYDAFPDNAAQLTAAAVDSAGQQVENRLATLGLDVSALDLLHQDFRAEAGDAYDQALEALLPALQASDSDPEELQDDVVHHRTDFAPLREPQLDFVDAGDGQVRVSWGRHQTGVQYELHYDTGGATTGGLNLTQSAPAASQPYELTGLSNDTAYLLQVVARRDGETRSSRVLGFTPHRYGQQFTLIDNSTDSHVKDDSYVGAYNAAAYLRRIDGRDVYVGVKTTRQVSRVQYEGSRREFQTDIVPVPGFPAERLNDVAAGNGLLVAVGDAGTVLVSADGQQWTRYPDLIGDNRSATLRSVTYAAHKFVIAGSYYRGNGQPADLLLTLDFTPGSGNCPGLCASSVPWVSTAVMLGTASSGSTGLRVAASPEGRFIAFGDQGFTASNADDPVNSRLTDGSGYAYVSTDGHQWQRQDVAANLRPQVEPLRVGYDVARQGYFALGRGSFNTSRDGVYWESPISTPGAATPLDMIYGPGQYVGVDDSPSNSGTYRGLAGARTPTGWKVQLTTKQFGIPAQGANALTFGNGRYLAFGTYLSESN